MNNKQKNNLNELIENVFVDINELYENDKVSDSDALNSMIAMKKHIVKKMVIIEHYDLVDEIRIRFGAKIREWFSDEIGLNQLIDCCLLNQMTLKEKIDNGGDELDQLCDPNEAMIQVCEEISLDPMMKDYSDLEGNTNDEEYRLCINEGWRLSELENYGLDDSLFKLTNCDCGDGNGVLPHHCDCKDEIKKPLDLSEGLDVPPSVALQVVERLFKDTEHEGVFDDAELKTINWGLSMVRDLCEDLQKSNRKLMIEEEENEGKILTFDEFIKSRRFVKDWKDCSEMEESDVFLYAPYNGIGTCWIGINKGVGKRYATTIYKDNLESNDLGELEIELYNDFYLDDVCGLHHESDDYKKYHKSNEKPKPKVRKASPIPLFLCCWDGVISSTKVLSKTQIYENYPSLAPNGEHHDMSDWTEEFKTFDEMLDSLVPTHFYCDIKSSSYYQYDNMEIRRVR